MFSIDDIFVYIFSWKKVTSSALDLYKQVHAAFPNVYFINCDETITIRDISSSHVIQLNDDYYYGGQFEKAIQHCPSGKILGCIVGDVSPDADWSKIASTMLSGLNSNKIGICAPNVDYTWHTARGSHLWDEFYTVPNTDCTCWFIHPTIADKLRKIPYYALSNLGWGIDSIFIKQSLKEKLYVARDYSTLVRQPKGTAYNETKAREQMNILIYIYNQLNV